MEYGKHTSRYLKEYGGLAFLDAVNADLLTLPEFNWVNMPDTLTLGSVEWELLGDGSFRIAYRYKGLILKFGQSQENKHNEREWAVYQHARQFKVHKHFAMALALLDEWQYGKVIVMEFVEDDSTWGTEFPHRAARHIYEKSGILICDGYGDNVKSKKIVDYGCCSY